MMVRILIASAFIFFIVRCSSDVQKSSDEWNKVVDGIHVRTGMKDDPNLQIVIGACTPCHSAQLVTQNRASREGWEGMIRWMQKTQNLGDLGQAEPAILDYLAEHYAPEETGRRRNLDIGDSEWYEIGKE